MTSAQKQQNTQRQHVLSAKDFKAALPPKGVLLGVDVGSKIMGLRLSNSGQSIATPRPALVRATWAEDAVFLQQFITQNNIIGLVVGEPKTLQNQHGQAVDKILSFVDLVKKDVTNTLPLTLWDERLTTVAAEREIFTARQGRQKRMSKKDSKQYVDSAAATLILQGFLDFLHPTVYARPT